MQKAKLLLVLAAPFAIYVGCKKEDESQPAQGPSPYPAAPYGQPAAAPAQPAPAQPTVAQPAPAPYPAPAPAPAPAPGQPAAGGLSTPSPMALPCTADANCITHRCNTAAGKCAWPCQSNNDCNPGNHCLSGACVPGQ